MTEQTNELDLLKVRADKLGITYSNNISLETLKKRVEDHLAGSATTKAEEEKEVAKPAKLSVRQQKWNEAMKLRRVRITLMNTKKAGMPGEVLSFNNEIVGTVKKFIPYDDDFYENGYHLPQCLINFIANKKFLHVKTIKDRATGRERTETSFIKEYAIEYLPDLTPEEVKALAQEQSANNKID